jgi:hypothetical protein
MMDDAKQPEPLESEPKESTASRIERREAEIALCNEGGSCPTRGRGQEHAPPASLAPVPNAQSFSVDPAR